ncbi:putative non-specific serine/threonine protein kinase [Helianthus annuus]|uniref:Non-specific serine/threonine protein kinase n=1 Tax=Helianthus annuus TaxID=4232 RepID=A0A9K3IW68_HELAN|nr:putative non-specific serine/threonine protein kinase [Helianthus annuus]KAJ0583032.1 putative non-specific serine/threonine protein kinase [Helianthus annuus]
MINLQTLAIYDTEISGLIPAELGLCTELRDLYLHMNRLTGPILHELGRLLKLTSLFLWGNSLTGSIPGDLSNCSSLIVLDVSANELSGEIPKELGLTLLLYNHIPNWNLQQLLQSNQNLDWETRYEIGVGSAQGLCNTPKI